MAIGDYAIELAAFPGRECTVWWLGCYTRGIDLVFGDRGTYCGVGIWLLDTLLWHSVNMVNFLRGATTRIALDHYVTEKTSARLSGFLEELPSLGWCAPVASDLTTMVGDEGECGAGSLDYIILPDSEKPTFNLAAIDVLQQMLARGKSLNFGRRVYFLAPRSRLYIRETMSLPYADAQSYADYINQRIAEQENSKVA